MKTAGLRLISSLFVLNALSFSHTAVYGNDVRKFSELNEQQLLGPDQEFSHGGLVFKPLTASEDCKAALAQLYNLEEQRTDSYNPELPEPKAGPLSQLSMHIQMAVEKRVKRWGDRAQEGKAARCFLVFFQGRSDKPSDAIGYINLGYNGLSSPGFEGTLEGGAKFPHYKKEPLQVAESLAQRIAAITALNFVYGQWPAKFSSRIFSTQEGKFDRIFIYTVSPGTHIADCLEASDLIRWQSNSQEPAHRRIQELLANSPNRFQPIGNVQDNDNHLVLEKRGQEFEKKAVFFIIYKDMTATRPQLHKDP